MKVYLVALNPQGEEALRQLVEQWEERESVSILKLMKDRVNFTITSLQPALKVEYYQIDFTYVPNNHKSRRKITANVYHKLKDLGITKENTEVIFNE